MLGEVVPVAGGFEAGWTDEAGASHTERHPTYAQAVQHVARHQAGGLRFHDLRHSYATWLVDDGGPPNMVQRVMGHERSSTTLDLYTGRTDNSAASSMRSMIRRTTARHLSALRHDPCSGNGPKTRPGTTKGLVIRLMVSR
jgi:hypothetical protein